MNCDIIKDLIPLYIDNACSDESRYTVETHLTKCENCKSLYNAMTSAIETETEVKKVRKTHKIHLWKASLLQSALFFLSFLVITVGVSLEAQTGINDNNGDWAFSLVIPATGFLLSLANWYFVRLYRSRLFFSVISALITFAAIFICSTWGVLHYIDFPQIALLGGGLFYTNIFVILGITAASYLLAGLYAKLLGKE